MSFYRQTEALFLVFEINLPVCSQSKLKVCKEVLLLWLEKEKGEIVQCARFMMYRLLSYEMRNSSYSKTMHLDRRF